nr:MAG TPA: hypothetical protein [Bacteriophage sp.]
MVNQQPSPEKGKVQRLSSIIIILSAQLLQLQLTLR